jgi:ATP-dependent HslUV protease ATP-binding subunit HslU
MEDISYEAPDKQGEVFIVDADYVKKKVSSLLVNTDLRRYII